MIKHVAVLDILYQNYLSTGLLLYTVEVRTIACVNLNKVALVDEERYTDFNTCLQCGWLSGVGGSIALESRLAVSNAEVGLYRHFGVEDSTVGGVGNNFHDVALFHILVADNQVVSDWNLLKSLLVHEDASCWILVEILVWTTLDNNILQFEAHLESTIKHATVCHVLQFSVHYCVALSWLSVLEIDAYPNAAIHANGCSLLNVL